MTKSQHHVEPSLADALALQRLHHRAARLRLALRALHNLTDPVHAPRREIAASLHAARHDFTTELAQTEAAINALIPDARGEI